MEYDENLFKAKANRRARNIWLVFSLLLTANYGADVANGLNTPTSIAMILQSVMAFFISLLSVLQSHRSPLPMPFR